MATQECREPNHTMDVESLPEAIRVLRGPRITLRPFQEADLPLRAEWMADGEISFLMTGRHADEDEQDAQAWWECHQDNPYTAALAIDDEDGEYLGDIDLFMENPSRRTYGLCIVIGDRSRWGRGYGSEALAALLRFAFDDLNASEMHINVFEFNTQAIRCYEKCGFYVADRLEQVFEHGGQRWSWLTMACTPDSFSEEARSGLSRGRSSGSAG